MENENESSQAKILIVDDQALSRDLMALVVKSQGRSA